jgi:hypothetical protein
MHKQLLITTVRLNYKLLFKHRRALAEIELYQDKRIKVPGSIVKYEDLDRPVQGRGKNLMMPSEEAI